MVTLPLAQRDSETADARVADSLKNILNSGKFAVTCELGPPQGSTLAPLIEKAAMVKGFVDAVNLTDCTGAMVRLSSLASSLAVMKAGIEPIMQITLRDRNRIGIQSDLLGASALGIHNILCLYGDLPSAGNEKEAKPVYDISTETLISGIRKMRDESLLLGGGKISTPPEFFIGAAASPTNEETEKRVEKVRRKVDAGAEFIQTQPVFDTGLFEEFMRDMNSSGISQRCHIIAGIMPVKSMKMARHLRDQVHGVTVTEEVVTRMENAVSPEQEGIRIALETVEELKKIQGLAGIHIMTVSWEQIIPKIVEEAGLSPRTAIQ
jgi:methylenetetrahydrofolate reductase (NADPH)